MFYFYVSYVFSKIIYSVAFYDISLILHSAAALFRQ